MDSFGLLAIQVIYTLMKNEFQESKYVFFLLLIIMSSCQAFLCEKSSLVFKYLTFYFGLTVRTSLLRCAF